MAVYLGSQQVNFNTTYGSFAYWFGFSRSVSMKSTSVSAARTATAKVIAPKGVSIYAYQTISSRAAYDYSTNVSINSNRYYLMGFSVNASLANFYQSDMYYVYPYISSVSSRASYASSSRLMCVGAMVFALGITDTKIIDSTLMLSYSTVSQSFFTGLIGPFTNISAPLLRSIPEKAFSSRSLIESVNFPSCTNIGSNAFHNCYNLVSISFPACTSISDYAFWGCSNLTSINFPNCTYIGDAAFSGCINLTSVNFPNCTSIDAWVFSSCSHLTSVNFPNCTFIGAEAFSNCYNLTSVNFPNCTFISAGAFWHCSNLTSVSFPNCTSIGSSAFYRCFTLTSISFSNCTDIYNNAFTSCYNLTSLNLIGVSAVPTLSTNVFASTPIGGYSTSAGRYGSVYVPASLYNDFIVAENWSDISSCIVSV